MDFKPYWRALEAEQRRDFAKRCETSVGYLELVATGHRKMSGDLALLVERESGGDVPVETTRPQAAWEVVRGKPQASSSVRHGEAA